MPRAADTSDIRTAYLRKLVTLCTCARGKVIGYVVVVVVVVVVVSTKSPYLK